MIDSTAKQNNVETSVKKFFIDNLHTAEGIELVFDTSLSDPPTVDNQLVTKWVTISFGNSEYDDLSHLNFDLYCCTRKDPEGHKLSLLRDTVMNYLTNPDGEVSNMRTIPFYEVSTWTLIGGIVISSIQETGKIVAVDGSQYKIMTCGCHFASKV